MKRKNMLNNIMLENARNSPAYQCLMTDLVLSGAISRSIGEKLLGYTIPSYLRLPKDFNATQPAPAPSGTGSSGSSGSSSGTGSSGSTGD